MMYRLGRILRNFLILFVLLFPDGGQAMEMNKLTSIPRIAVFLLLALLSISTTGWAATYYVRPVSGEYGLEDGSDYDNAFDGFTGINWGSLGGGDTLFVAGTFSNRLSVGASGTNDSTRLQIVSCTIANGASTNDAGVIDSANVGSDGAVVIEGDNWVTIDGLTVINTTPEASANGIRIKSSTGATIKNCTIRYNDRNGVYISDGSANWIVEYSDISYNVRNGFLIDDNDPQNGIIRYNTFDGNGASTNPTYCVDNDTGHSYFHNIYIGSQTQGDTLIYGNRIVNGQCGQGIKIKAGGKIYRNYIASNEDYGVMLIAHADKDGKTVNQYVYNNVIYNNRLSGARYHDEGESTETLNVYVYNNTLYLNGIYIGTTGAPELFVVKNNIIWPNATRNYCFYIPSGGVPDSSTIDYNYCYGTSSPTYVWGGSSYSFANWEGTLGFDTHGSYGTDPKFSNAPTDLSLASDSPCIDTGDNSLGNTYHDGLNPNSSWPDSVNTLDQDDYGSGWEIGGYVFEIETIQILKGSIKGSIR